MNTKAYVNWLNVGSFKQPSGNIKRVSTEVQGFSAPYLMALLSQAVRLMDEQAVYLEVGTLFGRTLIGAMIDNPTKHAISVDNFSMFGGTLKGLHANIEKFGLGAQIRCFETDADVFFETIMPDITSKVSVYLYDGNHNTDEGFKGLCDVVPYLSNEAIIILDDFSSHGVWRSVQQFLARYATETALLFCMRTNNFPFPDARWWNGVVVISWKADRNPASGV